METIVKSPYEGHQTAEIGEFLFEYMQSLIDSAGPEENGSIEGEPEQRKGPVNEAMEVFGRTHFKSVLETNRRITDSGILYASDWINGFIKESNCGRLPKELLLLCLRDHRIARGASSATKHIVKDLEAWGIVLNALRLWKLKGKYPSLARCNNVHFFKKRPNHCFKCILFLARAATCMKYLEWKFLEISDDTSLKTKIYACLGILESCVVIEERETMTRKRPMPSAKPVVDVGDLDCERNRYLHHNTCSSSDQLRTMDTGEKYSTNGRNDLSRRLRCKDCKIVGVTFYPPAPKKTQTQNKHHLEKSGSDLSCRLRSKNCKIVGVTFLPEPKKTRDTAENKEDKSPVQQITTSAKPIQPKKKEAPFSHALFATSKSSTSKISNQTKVVHVPRTFALATKSHSPPYVSDSSSTHSGSNNSSNFWYPVDKNELILSPIQIEMAWLVEESLYCHRSTKVNWVFMMKYASPVLQSELRRILDVFACSDEQVFAKFLHNGIEAKRFTVLRREIKRKLLKKFVRARMQEILPRLRMANHPLRLQKIKHSKINQATGAALAK